MSAEKQKSMRLPSLQEMVGDILSPAGSNQTGDGRRMTSRADIAKSPHTMSSHPSLNSDTLAGATYSMNNAAMFVPDETHRENTSNATMCTSPIPVYPFQSSKNTLNTRPESDPGVFTPQLSFYGTGGPTQTLFSPRNREVAPITQTRHRYQNQAIAPVVTPNEASDPPNYWYPVTNPTAPISMPTSNFCISGSQLRVQSKSFVPRSTPYPAPNSQLRKLSTYSPYTSHIDNQSSHSQSGHHSVSSLKRRSLPIPIPIYPPIVQSTSALSSNYVYVSPIHTFPMPMVTVSQSQPRCSSSFPAVPNLAVPLIYPQQQMTKAVAWARLKELVAIQANALQHSIHYLRQRRREISEVRRKRLMIQEKRTTVKQQLDCVQRKIHMYEQQQNMVFEHAFTQSTNHVFSDQSDSTV